MKPRNPFATRSHPTRVIPNKKRDVLPDVGITRRLKGVQMTLSPWQQAVAKTYGNGDFAHITSVDEAREVGDTLFLFLMIELDEKEGCDSAPEAGIRLNNALGDVELALRAVEGLL